MAGVILTWWNKLGDQLYKISDFLNSNSKMWIIVLAIVYKFSLDFSYIFAVSPMFKFVGMTLEPSAIKYVASILLFFIALIAIPKKENNISVYFLNFEFMVILLPMLTIYALQSRNNTYYMLVVYLCFLLQIYILKKRTKANANIVFIKNAKNYTIVFLIIFMAFCITVPILYNGFAGFKAFDFSKIYDIRGNAEYPPFFYYFLTWSTRAIIPFFIAYTLTKKQYLFCILLCLAQVVIFMTTGYKIILLMLPIILGVYLFAHFKILIKSMYFTLVIGCIVSTLLALLEQSTFVIWTIALWGRRFLLAPAQIKFQFFEVFSQYPHIHFGDGLIGHLFSLPYIYNNTSGNVVYAFFNGGSFLSQSNTGYWGESYAQLGFLGILLMSILIAYIVKFLDNYTINLGFATMAAVFSVPFLQLNDGALFTILLTGGLLVLVFLVFIFNEPDLTSLKSGRGSNSDNHI